MKHVIITRYNWGLYGKKIIQRDTPLVHEVWMSHRFQLFSRLCAASILNQSNKNFTWMLFFDAKTPQEYIDSIHDLLSPINHICYVYRYTLELSFVGLSKKAMEEHGFIGCAGDIITTRFDNDDVVHNTFVEKIQMHYEQNQQRPRPFTIDFPHGYRYVVDKGIFENHASNSNTYGSNCASLVEDAQDIPGLKTVMCHPHNVLSQEIDGVRDITQPMWVMCVHGLNSSRTNNPSIRHRLDIIPEGFFCESPPPIITP